MEKDMNKNADIVEETAVVNAAADSNKEAAAYKLTLFSKIYRIKE